VVEDEIVSKKVVIGIVALVVVVSLGFLALRQLRQAQAALTGDLQTVEVRRGTLMATASTAGSVQAAASVALGLRVSGEVQQVLVKEGDRVTAGQKLACLNPADAELQVAQAKANLAIAQARLDQAKKPAAEEDVAAARAALASAQESLEKLRAGSTARDIEIARLRWEQAKDQLWGAQAQRDATCGNPMAQAGACDGAKASVASAEMAVEIARLQYEQIQEGPGAAELRAAEAQVAQAQASLSRLTAGPATEDLRVAEAQVQQAEVAVREAEQQLARMCLVAPFDGTVTALDLQAGQIVGPTAPVGTLADLRDGTLEVVADMSEVDVARVKVGQEADITLDALRDRDLTGQVASVAAAGTSVQGVVNYKVVIRLDEADPAIKPGMSASVSIVTEEREDVLLVPIRAIRSTGGQRVVHLLRDGQIATVPVQVGLTGDEGIEILGDTLKEGDVLVLNLVVNPFERMREEQAGGMQVQVSQ
jgi:HlyD family secretion protein